MSIQELPPALHRPTRQPFPWRVMFVGVGLLMVLGRASVVRSIARFADQDARLAAFTPHVAGWLDAAAAAVRQAEIDHLLLRAADKDSSAASRQQALLQLAALDRAEQTA